MLLDTSGLYCCLQPDDRQHSLAKRLLKSADIRIVHSSVLSELIALTDARRKNRDAALKFVDAITNSPKFNVVWLDEADHRASIALLKARPDKHYSMCDAVSFVLMRRLNIREALTKDRHFVQEGFVQVLKSD